MKKNTKNVMRFTKGEKLLYALGVFCIVALVVLKVFSSASISNLKMSIERVTYEIEKQEKKNQSLVMQINELTSYENLSTVLKDMGLAYNNENIIVIK